MNNPIIIVDIETSALDPSSGFIIALSAIEVDLDANAVLNKFHTFCRPYTDFILEPLIKEITGLTDINLENAPSTNDAIDTFLNFSKGKAIWAYNADFMSKFINFKKNLCTIHDILKLAKICFPNVLGSRLDFFCTFLNISNSSKDNVYWQLLNEKDLLIECLRKNESSSSDFAYCYSCEWSGKTSDLYMDKKEYICPICTSSDRLIYNYPSGGVPEKEHFNDDEDFLCGVCKWAGPQAQLNINGNKYSCPACNKSRLWAILRCKCCNWVNFDFKSVIIDTKRHCPLCMSVLDKAFLPSLDN